MIAAIYARKSTERDPLMGYLYRRKLRNGEGS